MTLDNFLAPLKWTDEQVLRQYTQLANCWEGKGKSRYSLAKWFNITSFISYQFFIPTQYLLPSDHQLDQSYRSIRTVIASFIWGLDFCRNQSEPLYTNKTTDGSLLELSPTFSFSEKIGNCFRLPAFAAGLALMGKGGYELIDYLSNNNASSLPEATSDLTLGFSLFNYASSVYIKDYDPKLLDKQPFWKTAANYLKEKLSPQPTPVPVSNKTTLEDYLRG